MLKNAILFKNEIELKMMETWYDKRYQYYYDSMPGLPDFPTQPEKNRQFASVDDEGNVIGYMSYSFNLATRRAMNFGIISFDIGNPMFARDVRQMIAECFFKFHLNSIEWFCFEENSALKGYRKFIKRYGGREVGTLRNVAFAADGQIHNAVLFEICYEDLYSSAFGKEGFIFHSKLAEDTGYHFSTSRLEWTQDGIEGRIV